MALERQQGSICNKEFDSFILGYPSMKDASSFYSRIDKDEAMYQIYIEETNEPLYKLTLNDKEISFPKYSVSTLKRNGIFDNTEKNRFDILLVLRHHDKLIGFVELRLPKDKSQYADLFSVYVDPEYQNQGFASQLISYALHFFINNDYKRMSVSSTAKANLLYVKFGFYPDHYDENQEKKIRWFEMSEKERINKILSKATTDLNLDLTYGPCLNVFNARREQCFSQSKIEISQKLSVDFNKEITSLTAFYSNSPSINTSLQIPFAASNTSFISEPIKNVDETVAKEETKKTVLDKKNEDEKEKKRQKIT